MKIKKIITVVLLTVPVVFGHGELQLQLEGSAGTLAGAPASLNTLLAADIRLYQVVYNNIIIHWWRPPRGVIGEHIPGHHIPPSNANVVEYCSTLNHLHGILQPNPHLP